MNQAISFKIDGKQFVCSMPQQEQFTVQSIPRPYQVIWDETIDPVAKINELLNSNPKNLLLIDKQVLDLYGKSLAIPKERMFIAEASENFKTMDGVHAVLDFLNEHEFTKGETLVVVGGGIIQDVGAFVGACFKRGIRWVHFPTTLLSMCDSCIGGKTGINYRNAKNQIALFSAPSAVIINPHFLKTLPEDAIQSGLGEVLKLCITGGNAFIDLYRQHVKQGKVTDWKSFKPLILAALSIKQAIVEEDEFELNHRKSLNYGHTLGHVIESLSEYRIPHGVAVVLGILLANELSHNNGLLSNDEMQSLNTLAAELIDQQVINIMQSLNLDSLLDLVKKDKKVESSAVSFVMVKTAGEIEFVKLALDEQLSNAVNAAIQKVFLH